MDWEGPTFYEVADQIKDDIPDEEESGVSKSSLRVNIDYEWENERLFYWVETYPGSKDYDPEENFLVSDSLEICGDRLEGDMDELLMGTLRDELEIPCMVNGKVVKNKPEIDAFSDYEYTGDIDLHLTDDLGYV